MLRRRPTTLNELKHNISEQIGAIQLDMLRNAVNLYRNTILYKSFEQVLIV